MVDRPSLRLVPSGATSVAAPLLAELESALRLLRSDRGAIVLRRDGDGSIQVHSLGLSPEEEAACRSLARRSWQQSARGGYMASALGESTLLSQPFDPGEGDGALVTSMRSGGGKIDADRLTTLQDVSHLVSAAMRGAAEAERARERLDEQRRRGERVLALNRALQTLANSEDIAVACAELLRELEPHFSGVDQLSIWLLETGGRRLRRVAWHSRVAADAGPDALPLDEGLDIDVVFSTGETRQFSYQRSSRSRSGRLARERGVSTSLLVPLRSRNNVIGVLEFSSKLSRPHPADDQAFLETLGAQLGGQLDAIRELERTESEWQRLRTLIETLPVGIALLDATGKVALWNRAVEQIWGHGPVDADVGSFATSYGLFSAEGRPLDETPVERVLHGGPSETGQEFLVRQPRGGSERPVIVNVAPINDPQGRVAGVVAVFQDISQLREVDRLKDSFISTVSHELRTPTTTIRGGALTLLRRGEQLEATVRRQLLQDMADEAERLYHLVEDLLGLARAQAGMTLQTEPLIAHRFVNKVILDLGGRVGDHGLTVDVPTNLPLVDADPACLEQVLRNLLENAVKFSPRTRRIEIKVEARDNFVLFSVLDQGSGIPAADLSRVFEPFYKTAEAIRTGSQGAGLGLAVCQRLVQVQGGRIWAEPRKGGGTAFRFTLPAIAIEEEV